MDSFIFSHIKVIFLSFNKFEANDNYLKTKHRNTIQENHQIETNFRNQNN